MGVLVNPPEAALGARNVLLRGRARTYQVRDFPGPLSVKSVIRGEAWWETAQGRFRVDPGGYLVLNHGQPYSITVESREQVETFCAFFAGGFVEDALRGLLTPSARLLDDPTRSAPPCGFLESVRPLAGGVASELRRMHAALQEGMATPLWLEERFLALARSLHATERDLEAEVARLPAVRASTRAELHRRLRRARTSSTPRSTRPSTWRWCPASPVSPPTTSTASSKPSLARPSTPMSSAGGWSAHGGCWAARTTR